VRATTSTDPTSDDIQRLTLVADATQGRGRRVSAPDRQRPKVRPGGESGDTPERCSSPSSRGRQRSDTPDASGGDVHSGEGRREGACAGGTGGLWRERRADDEGARGAGADGDWRRDEAAGDRKRPGEAEPRPAVTGRAAARRSRGERAAAAGRPRLRLVPPPRESVDAAPEGPGAVPEDAGVIVGGRVRPASDDGRPRRPRGPSTGQAPRGRADAGKAAKATKAGKAGMVGRAGKFGKGGEKGGKVGDAGRRSRREPAAPAGSGHRAGGGPPWHDVQALRYDGQAQDVTDTRRLAGSHPSLRGAPGRRRAGAAGRRTAAGRRRAGAASARRYAAGRERAGTAPLRLTRRGRAVLVLVVALLSLGGFWLGTRAASPASAAPVPATPAEFSWVEVRVGTPAELSPHPVLAEKAAPSDSMIRSGARLTAPAQGADPTGSATGSS